MRRQAGRSASILTTISVSIRQTAIQLAEMRKKYISSQFVHTIYSTVVVMACHQKEMLSWVRIDTLDASRLKLRIYLAARRSYM